MEIGENTAVAQEAKPEEEKQEKIRIRCSVFFDGTLNNRTNIGQRLVSAEGSKLTDEEKRTAEELKKKMTIEEMEEAKGIYKKYESVGSYENGYTNIVKLEKYVDTEPTAEYELVLVSYIEGPGTRDKKNDKVFGYAIGTGISGVKNKVKKGVIDVVSKISAHHIDREVVIKDLTIDVFGFSRGAAAARHFIHKALLVEESIKSQLEAKGYKIGKVEMCFTGLYDTVSSHGLSFNNDTAKLNLDAVSHAKEVVHLAAADEHRENFSLTNIRSAGGNGREIYLPGVHSDIGGSYRDGIGEDHDIYWSMGAAAEDKVDAQIRELVDLGWYKNEDLTVKRSRHERAGGKITLNEVNLHAKRESISNQYSRIPLHIMAKYARDKKISIKSKLEREESIPPQLDSVYTEINNYVSAHEGLGAFSSKPEDWVSKKHAWLRYLRYGYFHFSARLEVGNGPRYFGDKRGRKYIEG